MRACAGDSEIFTSKTLYVENKSLGHSGTFVESELDKESDQERRKQAEFPIAGCGAQSVPTTTTAEAGVPQPARADPVGAPAVVDRTEDGNAGPQEPLTKAGSLTETPPSPSPMLAEHGEYRAGMAVAYHGIRHGRLHAYDATRCVDRDGRGE